MRKNSIQYANVVCKFGALNLVDRLEEVIIPSFVNDALVRKRGSNYYLFLDTGLVDLGSRANPDFCIVGRFVKSTILRRDQRLDFASGELVEDEQTLESAPSAFFVLRLLGHRLIYMAETAHAPTLSEFETTLRSRIKKTWSAYIHSESQNSEMTKTALMEITPSPSLQITAMGGGMEVSDFVDKFSKIRVLEITVNPRNDEVDASELSDLIEQFRQEVGGDTGKLTIRSTEGLDPEQTKTALTDLGAGGNQKTTLRGEDPAGDTLTGNEDDYSVVDEITDPPADRVQRSAQLLGKLKEKADAGIVRLGDVSREAAERILRVLGNG